MLIYIKCHLGHGVSSQPQNSDEDAISLGISCRVAIAPPLSERALYQPYLSYNSYFLLVLIISVCPIFVTPTAVLCFMALIPPCFDAVLTHTLV